jgi:hypothetical protein
MMKLLGLSVSLVIAAIVTLSSAVPTVNLGNPLHLRDDEPAPNPVSATCGRYGPCDLEKSQVCLNASTGLVCLRGCWEALLKCDGRSQCTNYNDGYMCCRRLDIEMPRTLCYKDGQLVEHPPSITLGGAADKGVSNRATRDGALEQISNGSACKPDGSRKCGLYYGTPSVFLCNVDKWEVREACTTDGWQDECKAEPEPHCTKSDDPCAGCGDHFEDCLLVSITCFPGTEPWK